MFNIETSIDINATPERVWQVLMDFSRYHEWNTLLGFIGGEAALGKTLVLRFTPTAGQSYTFKPVVTNNIPYTCFSWKAISGVEGIFDGEHFFELSLLSENRTRLINRELYKGILSPLMQHLPMFHNAQPGFESLNQ